MKKFFSILVLFLVAATILASCGSQNQVDPTDGAVKTEYTEPVRLPYTMEWARGVCDPNPVLTFVAQTGEVTCVIEESVAVPEMEGQGQDGSKEVDQAEVSLTGQEGPVDFSVSGAPGSVDPANVLRAQGEDEFGNEFVNTIDLGSEMMLAEPGSILVGPDFEDAEMVNDSPHMDWISPITQFSLTDPDEENANAAEGAFLWFTGAMVDARVRDVHIVLEGKEGHNWFLLVRGLFPDGEQDSDRNSTVTFTEYVAGHAQVMLYPPGAYISEENFEQVVELSHTAGRNCGKEGCSELSVMMLDLNTGAWVVIYQPQLDASWEFVDSNWR